MTKQELKTELELTKQEVSILRAQLAELRQLIRNLQATQPVVIQPYVPQPYPFTPFRIGGDQTAPQPTWPNTWIVNAG